MNSAKSILIGAVALVLLLVASASLFVVPEQNSALLLRLGKIVDSDFKPGLHFKMPVVQNVVQFDRRIQTLDAKPEHFLTSEKKFVVVDSYVKWRISDVAQYYRSTSGSINTTARLLGERINAALRDEFGQRTIQEVVAGVTWVWKSWMYASSRSISRPRSAVGCMSVCAPNGSG